MDLPKTSELPRVARVRQLFPRDRIDDVEAEVCAGLRRLNLGDRIARGHRVGITAGSRGIVSEVQPLTFDEGGRLQWL